ncbi:hypothetical protein [Aeropyrum camini]|uniref:hypothetical protein n=1 Tax=Aeropyrum camini TaxID=229980 RepID=UPI000789A173|nr:hypothetical protein [Aeropyrum camini]
MTRYTLYMASTPGQGLRILVPPSWSGLGVEEGYVDDYTGLAVLPSEVLDAWCRPQTRPYYSCIQSLLT